MNSTILLFAWWVFVGIVGYALFAFMRFLSNPNYRDDLGDISTEVGYSVDSYGQPKKSDTSEATDAASAAEEGFSHAIGHSGGPS